MNPRLLIGGVLVAGVLAVVLFSGDANAGEPDNAQPDPDDGQPDDGQPDDGQPDDGQPDEPAFVQDLDAEGEACTWVVANKPVEYKGAKAGLGDTLEQWLSLVGYRRAYPGASPMPTSLDELAALGRIGVCVGAKLKGEPKPDPNIGPKPQPEPDPPPKPKIPPVKKSPDPPPALPVPTDTPKPGHYFQIHHDGTGLLQTAGTAYNLGPGAARLAAAQHINNHPYNLRFHHTQDNLFPPTKWRISFNPDYGTYAEQAADPAQGAHGKGKHYAVIYIPE